MHMLTTQSKHLWGQMRLEMYSSVTDKVVFSCAILSEISMISLTYNKPQYACVTVPRYGQYLDMEGAEKACLVNPPPTVLSLVAYLPPSQNSPIQELQVLCFSAGQDLDAGMC